MFKSKELGTTPSDYFYKRVHELKTKLGNVSIPKQTRKNLIDFCRRMEPPAKPQLIPWCTTGEVPKSAGTTLDNFPWQKPAGAKSSKKSSSISTEPGPEPRPETSRQSLEQLRATIAKTTAFAGYPSILCPPESLVRPFGSPPKSTRNQPERNDLLEDKPIHARSFRNEQGVLVTNIAGIGDEDYDDDDSVDDDHQLDSQIIPLMSLETNPELKKLNPRYRLKKFGMYFVRVERVVDPLDFFMEFIQKPPTDGCQDWSECLQHFYSDPKVAAQYKMKTVLPLAGQRYAIYNDELGKWERVRVIRLSAGGPFALVAFLDRLATPLEINVGAFYELNVQFNQWPKYPLKGALKDVRPHNFVEEEDVPGAHYQFSQEAIQYFKEATKKDKIFRAFIIQMATNKTETNNFGYGDEDRFTTCMVYLFEVGKDKPMIPLNAEMVQKGFLKPIKSMECTLQLIKNLHGLDLQVEHPTQTVVNRVENLHLADHVDGVDL